MCQNYCNLMVKIVNCAERLNYASVSGVAACEVALQEHRESRYCYCAPPQTCYFSRSCVGYVETGLLCFTSHLFLVPVVFIKVINNRNIIFNSYCIVFLVLRHRQTFTGLTQSSKTSLMSITSGKPPQCSQKQIPHTIGLRKTEKERRDETEWKKQWEGMKERQRK